MGARGGAARELGSGGWELQGGTARVVEGGTKGSTARELLDRGVTGSTGGIAREFGKG